MAQSPFKMLYQYWFWFYTCLMIHLTKERTAVFKTAAFGCCHFEPFFFFSLQICLSAKITHIIPYSYKENCVFYTVFIWQFPNVTTNIFYHNDGIFLYLANWSKHHTESLSSISISNLMQYHIFLLLFFEKIT